MVKVRMNTADVAAEVKCLKRLIGMRCSNVYDISPKTYMFKLLNSSGITESGESEKVLLLMESGVRLHTTAYVRDKSNTPSGFTLKLRKHIRTRRLEDVRQLGYDRIIVFQFGLGANAHYVILELYAQGNIILTDSEYMIMTLLRSHRDDNKGFAIMSRHRYPIEICRLFERTTASKLQESLTAFSLKDHEAKDNEPKEQNGGKKGGKSNEAKQFTLKNILGDALGYGPQLSEHIILDAGLVPSTKLSEEKKLDDNEIQLLVQAVIVFEDWLEDIIYGQKVPEGYILMQKQLLVNDTSSQGGVTKMYDEFCPILLNQFKSRVYEKFETFDAALDEFYSKIESQRSEFQQKAKEDSASQKLNKIRQDQENRVQILKKEVDRCVNMAELIEYNLEDVDAAILAVRVALAKGMGWDDLARMVKEEKKLGNPVAGVIDKLNLEKNCMTLLLCNNLDEMDDDEKTLPVEKVEVDLSLSAHGNARRWYEMKKKQETKQEKTVSAHEKAFKAAEKKTRHQLSQEKVVATISHMRKIHWFEKFNWFISSENYLVISGRDAQQNEMIVKRYMSKGDLYVHAELHGASSTVIKNHKPEQSVPPLTLNQAGCFTVCHSQAWDSKIVRKIEKISRISYDGLSSEEDKTIFRYIACYFNGGKVAYMKLLLADSGLSVNVGLENLADKSLIHVREGRVEMHGLLKKMGKKVVRLEKPENREFLEDSQDIFDVLTKGIGTEKVLSISLNISTIEELHVHENAFKRMRNLRFLKVLGSDESGTMKLRIPKSFDYSKLKLLRWRDYPMRCLPSKFRPENLVELKMQNSKLEKLWEGVVALPYLKEMDLRYSHDLMQMPDLSKATNLEILNLSQCYSLVKLPSSIPHPNKLRKLNMRDCRNVETIPIGISLKSLEKLDLDGCSRLRTLPQISTNIVHLCLSETAIEEFPSDLHLENLRFEKLSYLSMQNLKSKKLWEKVQPLIFLTGIMSPSMRQLYLSDIPSLVELPSSFQNLHQLEKLKIENCVNLETLPTGINLQSLEELDLSGCSKLRTFPDISTNIQTLNLNETEIEEVPCWIEKFSRLEVLYMNDCINLETLPTGINLQTLSFLYLNGCSRLRTFPGISTNIVCLYLSETAIEEVPWWIEKFSRLRVLYMNGCINLETVLDLDHRYLDILNLSGCSKLRTFPNISTNIRRLNLSETGIEEVPCWIGKFFFCLLKLKMSGCSKLRTFPNISTNIVRLNLNETAIEEVPCWIEKFSKLEILKMKGCINLETLPTGINLQSLRELNLSGCSRLRTFPDISTNIQWLYLSETAIEEVPPWIEKSILHGLYMNGCINLETLPTGINLQYLEVLDLRGCSRLRTFPDISTNIQWLYLSETAIEEVPCWIEKFTRLEELEMNGCNKLKSVSLNISKLGDPYLVDFSDCKVMTGGSWSFSGGCTTFANFTNCLNLDQEALFRQNTHLGCRLCLSGEEVPSYFTHRTTVTSSSSSLTVRLLPSSLSNPFLRFRACIVLNEDNSAWVTSFGFKGRFWNSFDSFGQAQYFQKPKKISSMKKSVKGSYLLILECSIQAEMNYTHVDLQLDFAYCEYKVKEWGIRLCSSADNQLGYPNTLPHVFQTGEGNTLNEAGQGKKSGGEDEVTESSSKRMRIS